MLLCFTIPLLRSECKNAIRNFVLPIPVAVIIFPVKVGVLGYISFVNDLSYFIFSIGLCPLTGAFASFVSSITTLNFCFIFVFVDFLITSLQLSISNDLPCLALIF